MNDRRRPCVPAGDEPPYYKKVVPYLPQWPHLHFKVHLTKGMSWMKGNGNKVVYEDRRNRLNEPTVAEQVRSILRLTEEDTNEVEMTKAEAVQPPSPQSVYFDFCEFPEDDVSPAPPGRVLEFNFHTWMKMKLDAEILLEIIATSTPPAATRRRSSLARTLSAPELDITPVQRLPWRCSVLQRVFRTRTGRPGIWKQLSHNGQIYTLTLPEFLPLFPSSKVSPGSMELLVRRERTEIRVDEVASVLMSSVTAATVANFLFSALLGVGGVVGYLQAGSRVSLIAGSLSCLAVGGVAVASRLFPQHRKGLQKTQLVLASLLTLFFVKRQQTGKFMPGGLMSLVGLTVSMVTAAALKSERSPDDKNE
ncbi:hypothetical protein FOL47_010194 [Perkinsus chesapeaki]|uniref:Transmembrane protein 14 n=1 Tax=Perkinsus chesapeaki TaxID=330153 RepID=A0A7J6MQ40_PERCH|nr:hypothetical protein FOL47_010194 [Perkinsus chesapeaki]